jgi:hypothetical protein
MDYETLSSVRLEELRKYLKAYALSENAYEKREFALELLLKLGSGHLGAAQSPEKSVPSVGQHPSLDK